MKLNDFLKKLPARAIVDVEVPNANKDTQTDSAEFGGFVEDAIDFYENDDINVSEIDCVVRYRILCEPFPLTDEDDDGFWDVTYNIPLDLFNRIGAFSFETGISPNDIVRIAVESFLERQCHE